MFTPESILQPGSRTSGQRPRLAGFGLIELLITIVIVGIALVAILTVQSRASLMSADPLLRKQALAIAEGLLEEIMLAKFTYCDPTDDNAETATSPVIGASGCASLVENVNQETGGVGRPFDNVNDYVSAYGVPQVYPDDAAGTVFPTGYTASVTISPGTNLGPSGSVISPVDSTPANTSVLRITVSVSYPNSVEPLVLDGYRTRYAPNALP
jgi:MSHA pilin protein MshD